MAIKIDLITGFLGAGKTTFIKRYVDYLLSKGEKVCILENDLGPINVDVMLLNEYKDKCGIEMVSGGCDYDCHKRRFKTQLIAIKMMGYSRVIVEPSGIFDTDEFFDTLREDPLYDWYEIDNVITIVNADLEKDLSNTSKHILLNQIIVADKIILSKVQLTTKEKIKSTINYLNAILKESNYDIDIKNKLVINDFKDINFKDILVKSDIPRGYVDLCNNFIKGYDSLFYLNNEYENINIKNLVEITFDNVNCGKVFRIKGFYMYENQWYEINATKDNIEIEKIAEGQNIIIIIGENLNKDILDKYWNHSKV